jgi:hypothetical protein
MALHELHARRLATVASVIESSLDRIELALRAAETAGRDPLNPGRLSRERVKRIREKASQMRRELRRGLNRFSIQRPRRALHQTLAAELSTLWVTLENALPKRLKGYGRDFDPADRVEWEKLIRDLLRDIEQIRALAVEQDAKPQRAPR